MMFFGKSKPRELKFEKLGNHFRRPYSIYVSGGDWSDDKPTMEAWCIQQFGEHNERYHNPRWVRDAFRFKFKNEKDATMFLLRWG